jgi:transposase-like protein
MKDASNTPKTLQDAIKHFANYDNAHAFMVQIRWPSGEVCCPNCGSLRVRYIRTRRQWECREIHPKRRFTLKTGTIMEQSPIPLETWLAALWLEVNCKNSISSWEAHRDLGVTQKTAWFMLHRIRHALHVGSFDAKLQGVIEADETFVGGRAINMHKAKRKAKVHGATGGATMTPVMGLLARHDGKKHSTVRAEVLADRKMQTIHAVIHKNVQPGSQIYTDALGSYNGLEPTFARQFIDHAEKYVEGAVHTNGLENFWSLFKRCVKGTHVSIDPTHLAAYVDSEAFRFNNRKVDDGARFVGVAKMISGKRLTYKALLGASEEYTGGENCI